MESDPDVVVIEPPGLPLLDAARWVGAACWTELRLFDVVSGWLPDSGDADDPQVLWSIRSGRAAAGEAWHRRLPELREFPRAGFVTPSSALAAQVFDDLALVQAANRVSALGAVLGALRGAYRSQALVARGPADAPVSRTLVAELARLDTDLGRLDPVIDTVWAGRLRVAGDPLFGSGVL
jgi:hypothetical protein